MQLNWKKIFTVLFTLAAAWLAVRYLLPVSMPFLLGGLLALAAEPGVHFLSGRLRLSRSVAAGIGVGAVFAVLVTLATLLLGLLLRQLHADGRGRGPSPPSAAQNGQPYPRSQRRGQAHPPY